MFAKEKDKGMLSMLLHMVTGHCSSGTSDALSQPSECGPVIYGPKHAQHGGKQDRLLAYHGITTREGPK